MRMRTGIHGLATAGILLGSGCDYWRNLIEPKREDRVDLVLSVRDAWTGEALSSAWCSVDSAEALKADSDGLISIPGAPTGSRSVACTCDSFHERTLTLDAIPGQGRLDISMARMGGELWYPEDPVRHVRIELDSGNLLFPGEMLVRGSPGDTTGEIFHYTWSSTLHTGLRSLAKVPVRTPQQPGESVAFTLNLTVTATLAGKTYEVGRDSQTFTLARNRPPTLDSLIITPPGTIRVGPGCQQQWVSLLFNAVDPDGECQVRIRSRTADSPLGLLDTTAPCGKSRLFRFPVASHDGFFDQPRTNDGLLEISAFDQNGERADTSLKVVTISNTHPDIEIFEQVDVKPKNLTGQWMSFRIKALDRDTKNMMLVHVDWKNGESVTYNHTSLRGKEFLDTTLKAIWNQPGTYQVEARVEDACGRVHAVSQSITLVDNRIPTVRLEPGKFIGSAGEYEVVLEASDEDVSSGMDSLRVILEWGPTVDNKWVHQNNKPVYGLRISELVRIPFLPVPNATTYEIHARVYDLFQGVSYDTLSLSPVEAVGPN